MLWRQGGDSFDQPLDRTCGALPGRPALRDVVGRLVRTAHGDVAAVRQHSLLGARPGRLVRSPTKPERELRNTALIVARGDRTPIDDLRGGRRLVTPSNMVGRRSYSSIASSLGMSRGIPG
jgi:hypothetical protein